MTQSQQRIFLTTISDAAGLVIAILYTLAGQAHFTSRLTPGLAAKVDKMTPNAHKAFWFLQLNYMQLKHVFGAFDLISAALLWRKSTRKTGLAMAIVGFSVGVYGQWFASEDLGQVSAFLGLAVVGYLTAPSTRA